MSSHEFPTGALVSVRLGPQEIGALPDRLRERVTSVAGATGEWSLVGSADPELTDLLQRVIVRLPTFAAIHRRTLSENHIKLLIESIVSDAPRADVHALIEMDNARLRGDYLRETPTLTGAQIRAASGLSPKSPSEPASRWKRERRVFAVRHCGRDLYPAFQFQDGQPRPVIRRILDEMPPSATDWQIALWFASGNGWLADGAEPQTQLANERDVVEAAREFASPVEG